MKGNGVERDTLDGVIADLEFVRDTWRNGQNNLSYATLRDALQYLRFYKELADDSEEFAKWKENPPLTWDELKQMLDKPIWLEEREFCDDPFVGNWRLIDCIEMWNGDKDTERIRVTGSELESYGVYHNDMGEYWQAYRKERTDG